MPGIFYWRTPAGLQYRTTSDPPLLLDANQLASIPKPTNPDARLLPANHTLEAPLSPADLLTPADIDDPDNLPIPDWLT